jgi:hypothetical protein
MHGRERIKSEVMFILDNAPGPPESVFCENEYVEVVVSPPNIISWFQPLHQDIICFLNCA